MQHREYTMPVKVDGSYKGWTPFRLLIYELMVKRSQYANRLAFGGAVSIAKELGCSIRTVQRAIKWMVEVGVLVLQWASRGGRGIANVYNVILAGYRETKTRMAALNAKLRHVGRTRKIERKKDIETALNKPSQATLKEVVKGERHPLEVLDRVQTRWTENQNHSKR